MNAPKNRSKLDLNSLEAREVPAVGLSLSAAGALTLTGDGAADRVLVSTVGNQIQAQFTNAGGGLTTVSVDATAVTSIVMNGNGGNDYLANTTGVFSALNGGTGDDYLQGGTGNDTLNGNAGNDVLIDNAGGVNTFNGGVGDDQLSSTVAGATMNGGDGNDLLYDIIGGSTHNGGAGTDNIITNVGDTLVGNDRNNNGADLVTSFGATTARAAVLNRILYVNGTAGSDTITIDDAGPNVKVSVNGQTSFFGRASFRGIGVLGGDGNDVIDNNTGDANPATAVFMVAYGGNGNDDIRGSGGFDFMKGGAGNDFISARSGGGDFIGGDAGADTLVSDNAAGVDSGRDTLYADPTDTVTTDGRDKVVGTFLADWFST
jgi:Ca2+-binding RTX toxin-like protein